jgi:exopolysaccharide biosynthesis polyprenyl glycosylphosphotransferase
VGAGRWELWSALVVDHALILISWVGVAVAELLLRAGFSSLTPRAAIFPRLLGSSLIGFSVLFAVIATLFGYSEGLYQQRFRREGKQTVLVKSIGWATILLAVSAQLAGIPAPPPGWLLLGSLLTLANLLAWRRWRASEGRVQASLTEQSRNVLIVGAGPAGREVADYLEQHPEMGRTVRGFLDENGSGFGVLGSTEDLASLARAQFIDEIIIALPYCREVAQSVIREARKNHLDVRIVPDLFGCDVGEPWIENLGTVPLVTLHREDVPTVRLSLKRALDVVVSTALLLLAGPMMLFIALLVRLDSPGPAFYAASRAGRKGKRFLCFKFRTMVACANEIKEELRRQNERQGPCFKIVEDPRITRAGRWLRRYSLDELPQLWNVLKGEMSLVGPRPHPLDDFARYELDHLRRLDVTPGITGLWQVMARRSPSFQTNLALDLEYIENWSLWMDLRILIKTVTIVFQGTGT